MIKTVAAPRTLSEAIRYFDDPDLALAFVVQLRWPNGIRCPYCDSRKQSFLSSRRIWKCLECRKQFSVKVGTIFEDSPLGLNKWLPALWMLANAKNGISSYELHRALGVTQKTAWFMLHRIRLAMDSEGFDPFDGSVEMDESYLGGRYQNMHLAKRKRLGSGQGQKNKVAVLGMLQRPRSQDGHSRVRTTIVGQDASPKSLYSHVAKTVKKGATLYTDAAREYGVLDQRYVRYVINHAREYVRGHVHTNGIENFWSLLKRTIKGTYIAIDPFHVFRYLDEQAFRFNQRGGKDRDRFQTLLNRVVGKRITYTELIGADLDPATT